jgi:flagellar biosynthesis/type III secretory pathway chaperone
MPAASMSTVEQLHSALLGETDFYRQLVALTQREREALQNKNITSLTEIIRQKEDVLSNLAQGEKVREEIVQLLSQDLNLPHRATLQDITAVLEDPFAGKLSALRQELSEVVDELLALNQGNSLIVQSQLDQVDATLEYLSSCFTVDDGNYDQEGAGRGRGNSGQVLNWQV